MWRSLHDAWWRLATGSHPTSFRQALASCALEMGAAGFGAAVAARNLAYDRGWLPQARLPCRVISVGNLTVGGTGKTACVELLARRLLAQGRRVAIITRGYGGRAGPYALHQEGGQPLVDGAADEPQLLAARLPEVPVIVGARRAAAGRTACARFAADTVILDDGFQHRQVARDCEIVLVSARMPLGGWALLPRGPMREPVAALRRADIVIITKTDDAFATLAAIEERLRALAPRAVIAAATHEPVALLDPRAGTERDPCELDGLRVGLVSSIGDPEGFEATVERLHGAVAWHRRFPDHHRFTAEEWGQVLACAAEGHPAAMLTTEKDWMRLRPLVEAAWPAMPVWVLRVRLALIKGAEDVHARLARVYAG